MADLGLSLVTTPRENRAACIVVLNALTGVAGFVGGLVSGPLLERHRATIPGTTDWTTCPTLFAISALLQTPAWTLLRRVPEEGARRTSELLGRAHLTRISVPRPPCAGRRGGPCRSVRRCAVGKVSRNEAGRSA